MTLLLPERLEAEIDAHASREAPEEVVGVLAGERNVDGPDAGGAPAVDAASPTDRTSVVERVVPAENAAARPETRYEIAPADELELLELIDDAGLDVVGFYHSHPRGPPGPSPTDERLAAWVGYSYVVVSLADAEPTLGSWRWTGDAFEAESVERP